jgi:hypothetical protein
VRRFEPAAHDFESHRCGVYPKRLRNLSYAECKAPIWNVLLCTHALIVERVDTLSQSIYDLNMTDFSMTDLTGGPLNLWPLLSTDSAFRLAHPWLIPPDIRLDGDVLRYGGPSPQAREAAAPSIKLLNGFIRLATAEPAAIAKFAKTWGVLGLCQHEGMIAGHQYVPEFGSEPCRLLNAEPIERWHYYAGALKWLLEEGAALRGRKRQQRQGARVHRFLDACYRLVLYFGCLRPMLVLQDGRFDIKLGGASPVTGLASALTTQFLFTVAGAAGLATCAGCGALFMPRRRPAKNRRSYCTECGIRAAWRNAQQRRRQAATLRGEETER